MNADAQTAPRALQLVQLLLLTLLSGYFGYAYSQSLGAPAHWVAFGGWQMFSLNSPSGSELAAEIDLGDGWERLALEKLFPSRWDSGYRYSRTSFRKSPGKLSVLGASACYRYAQAHGRKPLRVRFFELRWGKRKGTMDRVNEKRTDLRTHRCDVVVRLPGGRTVPLAGKP